MNTPSFNPEKNYSKRFVGSQEATCCSKKIPSKTPAELEEIRKIPLLRQLADSGDVSVKQFLFTSFELPGLDLLPQLDRCRSR